MNLSEAEVREKFVSTNRRLAKAIIYVDDPNIPQFEKDKYIGDYLKTADTLEGYYQTVKSLELHFTAEELAEGFIKRLNTTSKL